MRLIEADALKKSLIESADRCREWITACMDDKDNEMQSRAEQALFTFNECILRICTIPTIEERKKGKWIERNPQNSDKCRLIECDQCGFSHIVGFNVPYEHWIENRNFCERCGADMRKGEGEKE